MVNAQEWLDDNYPKETRKEIKELYIGSSNRLEGSLKLEEFTNLIYLNFNITIRNKI